VVGSAPYIWFDICSFSLCLLLPATKLIRDHVMFVLTSSNIYFSTLSQVSDLLLQKQRLRFGPLHCTSRASFCTKKTNLLQKVWELMVGSKRSFFGLTHASPTKNMSKINPFHVQLQLHCWIKCTFRGYQAIIRTW